jgi:divalent metal cation (Fe/Co/Zn/Cd) transporter
LRIAGADPDVRCANGVMTVQLGPSHVVAALSAEFHDHLTTTDIEAGVNRIERAVKQAHHEVTVLFIKPQTAETWRSRIELLAAEQDDGR